MLLRATFWAWVVTLSAASNHRTTYKKDITLKNGKIIIATSPLTTISCVYIKRIGAIKEDSGEKPYHFNIRLRDQEIVFFNKKRSDLKQLRKDIKKEVKDAVGNSRRSIDQVNTLEISNGGIVSVGDTIQLKTEEGVDIISRSSIEDISPIKKYDELENCFEIITKEGIFQVRKSPEVSLKQFRKKLLKWIKIGDDSSKKSPSTPMGKVTYLNLQTWRQLSRPLKSNSYSNTVDLEILWPEDSISANQLYLSKLVSQIDTSPVTFQLIHGSGFSRVYKNDLESFTKLHPSLSILKHMNHVYQGLVSQSRAIELTTAKYDSNGGFLYLNPSDLASQTLKSIIEESETQSKIFVHGALVKNVDKRSGYQQCVSESESSQDFDNESTDEYLEDLQVNLAFSTGLAISTTSDATELIEARENLVRYFYSEYSFVLLTALQGTLKDTNDSSDLGTIFLQCLADPADHILFSFSMDALAKVINTTSTKYSLPKIKLLIPHFDNQRQAYDESILEILSDGIPSGRVVLQKLQGSKTNKHSIVATTISLRD